MGGISFKFNYIKKIKNYIQIKSSFKSGCQIVKWTNIYKYWNNEILVVYSEEKGVK